MRAFMNRFMAVTAALGLLVAVVIAITPSAADEEGAAPDTSAPDTSAPDTSGWDWGSFESADETPISPKSRSAGAGAAPEPPATPAAEADTAAADTAAAYTAEADTAEADTAEADTTAADTAEADTAEADGTGWDWGSFEAMDDTPVTAKGGTKKSASADAAPAEKEVERRPARAAPDFESPLHSGYALFAGVPEFEVIPAAKDEEMHPCGNCHEWAQSNPEPRKLADPHDNFELQHGMHGKGGFWCFTCHDLSGSGGLKTLEGERLEFDEAYVLCSQCHVDQARDWSYGAHGKRVGNWQGERTIYNCTACHYQHSPQVPLREPLAPPPVRMGLERPEPPHHDGHGHPAPWELSAAHASETTP